MQKVSSPYKDGIKLSVMLAAGCAIFFASFLIGRYPVSPMMVMTILTGKIFHLAQTWPPMMERIVMNVRLPRIVAAMLVGSALAVSGAAYQNI
ncbi:MAG: iron chelate uptake ABC transporter family permease subunit, partial [Bacillota bacterium]